MPRPQRYDSIGVGYASCRRPDPRISARIYVPTAVDHDVQAPVDLVAEVLETDHVEIIRTLADGTDGFGSAYWRRPERYLDPCVRAGISAFARLTG